MSKPRYNVRSMFTVHTQHTTHNTQHTGRDGTGRHFILLILVRNRNVGLYLLYYFWSICIISLPANNNGCRFGHHRCQQATNYSKTREVDRNKLITTFIYNVTSYYFVRNHDQHHGRVARTLDRAEPSTPHCWRGERLGHHGCGGLRSWCGVVAILAMAQAYCKKKNGTKTLRNRLTGYYFVPHWRAPHPRN
jgi:hypothetical protein